MHPPLTPTLSSATLTAVVLSLGVAACGGSPSTPTTLPPAATPSSTVAPPAASGQTGRASGVVIDTEGRPIAGARLKSRPPLQGCLNGYCSVDVLTDASGAFAFDYPTENPAVTIAAPDHEPGLRIWKASSEPVTLRIVLRRRIVIGAGSQISLALTNDDPPDYVGEAYDSEYCSPCKLIVIDPAVVGQRARISLEWTGDEALQMWVSDSFNVLRAQSDGERTQVLDVNTGLVRPFDRIYVGLPLVQNRLPQKLAGPTTIRVSVQ